MKGLFPIKDISGISGHTGAIFPIWRIKGVVFHSPKWNHMRSCLLIRLALDLTHVMGIWLINRAFQSYTHWPPDPTQRGHCFPFTNEVDVGVFLCQLQVCDILFLFKSLKSERTKLSETPAGKYRRQSEPLEKKFVFSLPREAGEDSVTSQLEAWRGLQPPPASCPRLSLSNVQACSRGWHQLFKSPHFSSLGKRDPLIRVPTRSVHSAAFVFESSFS